MTWLGREAGAGSLRGVVLAVGALVLGAAWWWAALRLALVPGRTGVVEGAVFAGGWGLSVLPVHCVPFAHAVSARRRARQEAARWRAEAARWRAGAGRLRRAGARAVTRAWRRRRWGGGSGPS
ncbi:hypothetical protein QIS99_09395 [Streptomyces sp. B-S-A8]|uniref:Uncharacterized protein n=1 Tax=Streptomyces solicavernae TaxID=3043614 RepID=A0ABT6RPR3_9ACTN|nr:hypothetical protein [Streptomyces sp. B-S-A8]MDI3386427.1 hypothetical protein [Streptomyces sp. B-S-A8]